MKILITGGAGFIGSNTAKRFSESGHEVVVLDNLSRKGTDKNLKWLKDNVDVNFIKADIREFQEIKKHFIEHSDTDAVLHLAAQVAVTSSVINPREDFEINALDTFNICEGVRQFLSNAILLNASTNKVYGSMENLQVIEKMDDISMLMCKVGCRKSSR